MEAASESMVARSGRGIPCGGMAPTRSLRTTFSQVSACGADIRSRSELVEHQAGGLGFFVVAGDAILIDQSRRGLNVAAACRRRDRG